MSPSRTSPGPNPARLAWAAVGRCILASLGMIARREIRLAHGNLGRQIQFADGSSAPVYRETVVPARTPTEPCLVAVTFRLRHVRGRGHTLFRMESILNTPLFVGFPGFVSKLWLAHDGNGRYRGLYEWDGADAAENYARSLWRVLALVSEPDSIDYRVLPRRRCDEAVDPGAMVEPPAVLGPEWWRVATPPGSGTGTKRP